MKIIKNIVISSVVLLVASILFAFFYYGIGDYLIPDKPPLVMKIKAHKSGVVVDEVFYVNKKCAYEFRIDFFHKNKEFNELKDVLYVFKKNKRPKSINVRLIIELNSGVESETVYEENRIAELYAVSQSSTKMYIDSVSMSVGEYRAILEIKGESPELKNIETEFVVARTPKTNCT